MAEKAIDSTAARASVDYIGNVIKGQRTLNEAVKNVFKSSSEIIAKDLMPNQESRDRVEKSLAHFQANPMTVGGSIGHYLPDHSTAAAQTAAQASQYLNSLKPKQMASSSPLDASMPIDKNAQARYNRALDIAQQP